MKKEKYLKYYVIESLHDFMKERKAIYNEITG